MRARVPTVMTTTLHSLSCQGCGASVPVKEGARYVDCAYCRSRLEVVAPEPEHAELVAKCDTLQLREELRGLDAAWERYLRKVSVKVPSGELHPPGAVVAVESGMVCSLVTVFLAVALAQVSSWTVAVVIPAGAWISWKVVRGNLQRKREFESTQLMHEVRRKELVRRLDLARRAAR